MTSIFEFAERSEAREESQALRTRSVLLIRIYNLRAALSRRGEETSRSPLLCQG